ncbi:hypothetical protein NDU88_003795, partial [Pleurodeles waltl]
SGDAFRLREGFLFGLLVKPVYYSLRNGLLMTFILMVTCLYESTRAEIIIHFQNTGTCKVGRDTQQGCPLLP